MPQSNQPGDAPATAAPTVPTQRRRRGARRTGAKSQRPIGNAGKGKVKPTQAPTPARMSGWLRRQMRNGRSLADIEAWLRMPDVIEQLGAARVDMHRKELEREHQLTLAESCSGARMAGWLLHSEHYYAPGMVLSRVGSRADSVWGGGLITPRWTPALAVRTEDLLDRMDAIEAAHYEHPPSITGIQIMRIRAMKGTKVRLKARGLEPPVTVSLEQTGGGPRLGFEASSGRKPEEQ